MLSICNEFKFLILISINGVHLRNTDCYKMFVIIETQFYKEKICKIGL